MASVVAIVIGAVIFGDRLLTILAGDVIGP